MNSIRTELAKLREQLNLLAKRTVFLIVHSKDEERKAIKDAIADEVEMVILTLYEAWQEEENEDE